MIRILESIDIKSVLECYYKLEPNITWTHYPSKGKQAGLQYNLDEDPWTSAVGKHRQSNDRYIEINPIVQNTIFETIIKKFSLSRSRFMWLDGMSCYSMHVDETPRLHIPIITNHDCYFVFKAVPPVHLKTGNVYFVDTRKCHSFMNCSDQARLHFVGCLPKHDSYV